eukprot:2905860-Pleurochrysis_carterae.AAC.1
MDELRVEVTPNVFLRGGTLASLHDVLPIFRLLENERLHRMRICSAALMATSVQCPHVDLQ